MPNAAGLAKEFFAQGVRFFDLSDFPNAELFFRRAAEEMPDNESVLENLLAVLGAQKKFTELIQAGERLRSINPTNLDALFSLALGYSRVGDSNLSRERYDEILGAALAHLTAKRYDKAFACYDRAFLLAPTVNEVEGWRLICKLHMSDWASFEAELEKLRSSIWSGRLAAAPLIALQLFDDPVTQLMCARAHTNYSHANVVAARPAALSKGAGPLHVAYVSADFRHSHPVANLVAGLFEEHDRSRFRITAVSIGKPESSPMRRRMEKAVDEFVDAHSLTEDQIVEAIKGRDVDILVDLNGYMSDFRAGIFAKRPCHIQVNFLGFPGTMGAPFIDYIIADGFVVPRNDRHHYSEKIVAMPHTYLPTDRKRALPPAATRSWYGLPPSAFVYCCFNNGLKIMPEVFACWMEILRQVPGSVLWLLEQNKWSSEAQRAYAARCGVEPSRLFFAPLDSPERYMARHEVADLFLDTLPFNGHSTTTDALWCGLPVLTRIGNSFAGRVAASLLNAMGTPELVTSTKEEYVRRAVDLARDRAALAALKNKIRSNRLEAPLFDTARYTRHLEWAFEQMHRNAVAGLAPDHIEVPGL